MTTQTAVLPTQPFGKTDMRITRVGFGAWTLAWPGVTGAIVGARNPSQVDGWLDAATLELTDSDMAEIATAIERGGAGAGPTMPSY